MSAETKWTPGPWVALRSSAYWEIIPDVKGPKYETSFPFTIGDVCASQPGNPDSGLQEANAHLIAQAPRMYEALDEALKDLVAYQWNARDAAPRDHRWEGVSEKVQPTIDRLREVMAAARGES